MKKITPKDVQTMAKLGLSMRPEDLPLTCIALARLVDGLQTRVAELERAQRSPVRRFFDRVAEVVR